MLKISLTCSAVTLRVSLLTCSLVGGGDRSLAAGDFRAAPPSAAAPLSAAALPFSTSPRRRPDLGFASRAAGLAELRPRLRGDLCVCR